MKYVLDSSVAFKWLVAEKDTAKALKLRDDFLKGNLELISPDFFHCEVRLLTRLIFPLAFARRCRLATIEPSTPRTKSMDEGF